jgi:hypothetical protein
MKESEYYQRAFDDPAFCREKIDSLRYFRKVEIGLGVFSALGFVATTLYGILAADRWDAGEGWIALLAVNAGVYVATSTRLAALEAIERKTTSVTPSITKF